MQYERGKKYYHPESNTRFEVLSIDDKHVIYRIQNKLYSRGKIIGQHQMFTLGSPMFESSIPCPCLLDMETRGSITDEELDWLRALANYEKRCFYCGAYRRLNAISKTNVCDDCYRRVFGTKGVTGLQALKEWW